MTPSASTIAAALSKRRPLRLTGGGFLVSCPVPSHGKGRGDRNPSLSIADGDKGIIVHCFGGCDPRVVFDELRREGLIEPRKEGVAPAKRPLNPSPSRFSNYERRQHDKAAWLWSQRKPIGGTIAEIYLRQVRRITCALLPTLAFLPSRKPEHHPAMIAAFSLPDEPEPGVLSVPRNVQAVHLTLLRRDGGGKAEVEDEKLFVGSPGNLPIVLAASNDLLGMAITEGIEDALTVHQATGLGAWAGGSASRLPAMTKLLRPYVESVTVLVDDDVAGRRGAGALARLLVSRGIETRFANIAQLRGPP